MRILEIKAFPYDELPDDAKARARDWWRAGEHGLEWAEPIISDAVEVASRLGIEFKDRIIRTLGGKEAAEPCISWTVGGCQGDGASFEGRYTPKAGSYQSIVDYAPLDSELHSIAIRLESLVAKHGSAFVIEIGKHSSYYDHSGTMNFEASYTAGDGADDPGLLERTIADDFSSPLRQFADWIYRQLERAHDDYFSDEQVAGAIRANEYEFTADGSCCAVLN